MGDPIIINASDLDALTERLDLDTLHRRIRELHAEGRGRNQIADELGIGRATVSKHAADLGLSFSRASTEEATRARQADLLDKRSQLEQLYLDDALALRAQLWQVTEYASVSGGGEDGPRVVRYDMDRPTAADQLRLVQASTAAAAASQKIADSAVDQSAAAAKSMLVHMMDGLKNAYREVQAADSQTTDQPGDTTP